jgi:general secretion pathway protein H
MEIAALARNDKSGLQNGLKGRLRVDLWHFPAKRNGFTLLEVIMVLTLITIILGLSTVYFAGFLPSVKLNATGREVSSLIRHARSLARMNMKTLTVMIDLDEKAYGIKDQVSKNIPPGVMIKVVDPASGEILHGKYPLVFHKSGGMEGGAIILSGGKKKIRIDMDPITGAVLIKQ